MHGWACGLRTVRHDERVLSTGDDQNVGHDVRKAPQGGQEVDMASGTYARTCQRCQTSWSIPADIAEERPTMQGLATRFASMVTASPAEQLNEQAALRAHYQQLANAAKCPNCGATSFTQQQSEASPALAESPVLPDSSGSLSAPPPSAHPAPAAPGAQMFVLNQKLISLTGDQGIEDGQGNHAFEVDGTLLSVHGTHVLKDVNGEALYEIQKPLAPHLHKTIEIKKNGQTAATVQEAIFHLGGDKFRIGLAGGPELTVHGNWSNREFQVTDQAGQQVIAASRAWFSIRDAYGIQIASGFEIPLGLAIVVALERVEAQEQGEQSPVQNLLGRIGSF